MASVNIRGRQFLADALDATAMSERDLARQAGLGHATVNHLLTGRRTRCKVETAVAIETVLGCDPGVIFERAIR